MNKNKLNSLVTTYKANGSEGAFNAIYNDLVAKPHGVYEEIAKSLRATAEEVIEVYEDTLLRCLDKFDGTSDFENYFKRAIRFERAGIYNRAKRKISRECTESELTKNQLDDHDISLLELAINNAITEDNSAATEYLRKKKADQRQLIDSLVRNADATTTAIVEAVLTDDSPRFNSTAIERKVGVHRKTVMRKLRNLAKNFDSQKFGNYRDYLFAQ